MIYDENKKTTKQKMIKKNTTFLPEERYSETFKTFSHKSTVSAITSDWSKWRQLPIILPRCFPEGLEGGGCPPLLVLWRSLCVPWESLRDELPWESSRLWESRPCESRPCESWCRLLKPKWEGVRLSESSLSCSWRTLSAGWHTETVYFTSPHQGAHR